MKAAFANFFCWFFEKGDPRGAAALRIGYGFIYLFILWDLYPVMDLVMGYSGLNGSIEKKYFIFGSLHLLYFFDLPWQLKIWFWGSIFFAVTFMLGFMTRISSILVLYSIILFQKRGPYFVYGADQVLVLCVVLLIFAKCGQVWSVDNLLRRYRGKTVSRLIEQWPIKTIQIQVALIYLTTGLAKFASEYWRNGSGVYYAIQSQIPGWLGSLDRETHRPLLALMTYLTMVSEIGFAPLVFWKPTRFYAILAVFLMHIGIDLFMEIRFFSLVMYVGYLAFIKPSEWEWLAHKSSTFLYSLRSRAPWA